MDKLSMLATRYMRVNMKRTVTTCIGIIVSTILIYMILSIGYSIYFSDIEEEYKYESLMCDGIIECDGETAREIVDSARYYGEGNNAADVNLSYAWAVCIDDNLNNVIYINDFIAMPRQLKLIKGTFPKNDNSIILPIWYSEDYDLKVGSSYNISNGNSADTDDNKSVSGFYDVDFTIPTSDEDLSISFTGAAFIGSDEQVFNSDNVYVFVTFADGSNISEDLKTLGGTYNASWFELSEIAQKYYEPETDLTYSTYRVLLLMLAFIGIILSVVIIRNAFNISVHTRSKDYGILRCIGMSRTQIIIIILSEALLISLIGMLSGLVIGHGISYIVFEAFKKILKLSGFYKVRLIPQAVYFSILSVLIATFYAMISPVEKLYRINPISAIRMNDEYKISEKKIKAGRGKLLEKIFGVEAGYAYKNILRDKKRFLLLTVTLIVWTVLATAVLTMISGTNKAMYDLLAPVCEYDGAVEYYSDDEEAALRDALDSTDEIEDIIRIDKVFVNDRDNNLTFLCYGFPKDEYIKFTQIASGYKEDREELGVLLLGGTEKETGDTLYGSVKVAGEINNLDEFGKIFGKYFNFSISDTSFSHTMIYNIDDEREIFDEIKAISTSKSLIVKFNNELKHPNFDELIDGSGYYFDDYFAEYRLFMDSIKVVKVAIITFLVFIFILYMINTINTNSSEMLVRKSEIGILRTIGMSKSQVDRMLYLEGAIVSVIAAFIGNIIGSIAGNVIIYMMLFAARDKGEGAKFAIHIDLPAILFVTIILLIINIFAVWATKPKKVKTALS